MVMQVLWRLVRLLGLLVEFYKRSGAENEAEASRQGDTRAAAARDQILKSRKGSCECSK